MTEVWFDNSIQFPRLLSEIMAIGLTKRQWADLLETMDLESSELEDLFSRAQGEWDEILHRSGV